MSKTDVIILRAILVIVIYLLFRTFKPQKEKWGKKLSIGMRWGAIAAVVVAFIVIGFFIKSTPTIGLGDKDSGTLQTTIEIKFSNADVADCILIREDSILIDGKEVTDDFVEDYINQHVENNVLLTIVDDYSSSECFRRMIDLCKEKGVNYEIKDEAWLETK